MDDLTIKTAPKTQADAQRMYKKGAANLTDEDLFGSDAPAADDNANLDYLGHFANDNVTREGHNKGRQPKGKVVAPGIAKSGYRTLPGSAIHEMGASITSPKIERAAMATIMMPTPSKQPYRSSKADRVNKQGAPPTAKHADTNSSKPPKGVKTDMALSARHHRESVKFNAAHAKDHAKEVTKHKKALKKLKRK